MYNITVIISECLSSYQYIYDAVQSIMVLFYSQNYCHYNQ